MNTRTLTWLSVAVMVFGLSFNCADAAPKGRVRVNRRAKAVAKRPLKKPAVKQRLDKNNNGKVSKRELIKGRRKVAKKPLVRRVVRKPAKKPVVRKPVKKAARKARRSSIVSRFDANGDGRLSGSEWKAWNAARKNRRANQQSGVGAGALAGANAGAAGASQTP